MFILKIIDQFQHINDLRDRFFPAYQQLTQEDIEWKPEGYKNNIAFFLRHTAQAEDWFLQAVILQKEMVPKGKKELPTIKEILDYLHDTRKNLEIFMQQQPIELLEERRAFPEGFRGEPMDPPTISWLLNRVFSHEVYHLGQVNMLMRLRGLEPPSM